MKINRRNLLVAGTSLAVAPAFSLGSVEAAPALKTQSWNDGLAHPFPYGSSLGAGKERGLVLGGGGAYLLSWMMGYFHALKSKDVDLATSDVTVGTSAGASAGASLMGGQLWRLRSEVDILAEFPKLFAELMPQAPPNESQIRASKMAVGARNARIETIQAIGRAAMASKNPAGEAAYPKSISRIIGESSWPSPKMHTTAVDCYTGERLVVSQEDGVPINVACAASASLPGGMGPTFVKNRLCMDGGICQTSTHSDVVTGVKRALIISLTDGGPEAVKIGLRTSGMPNTLQKEVKALQAGGTKVKLKVVGLLPGVSKVDSIMDPKWIGPLLKWGYERGLADADEMKTFWL